MLLDVLKNIFEESQKCYETANEAVAQTQTTPESGWPLPAKIIFAGSVAMLFMLEYQRRRFVNNLNRGMNQAPAQARAANPGIARRLMNSFNC